MTTELPESVGSPINLGFVGFSTIPLRASAITAGDSHTCVIVTGAQVKCWGAGSYGQLGHGDTNTIGDNETPASIATLNIGKTSTMEESRQRRRPPHVRDHRRPRHMLGQQRLRPGRPGTTDPLGDSLGERPNVPVQLPNGVDTHASSPPVRPTRA